MAKPEEIKQEDFIISEVKLVVAVPSYGIGSVSPLDYVMDAVEKESELTCLSYSERDLTIIVKEDSEQED